MMAMMMMVVVVVVVAPDVVHLLGHRTIPRARHTEAVAHRGPRVAVVAVRRVRVEHRALHHLT